MISLEQVDHFAVLITSPFGVALICIVIVLWAVIAYLIFRIRINSVIRELRIVGRSLAKIDGEQGFAENFEQYDENVSRSSVLKHVWHEFGETLIKDPASDPPSIRNTRSAGEYFTRGAVVGNRLNLRFYSALPNLLTGSGILGTFIGLVAGIWLASKGLASPDAATVKQALQQLLNGASLAFSTSIAGLITSILFSWREKHWIHKLDGLRGRWINMLDSRLERVTGELLSHSILSQTQQQTRVLEQFTTDLAFQIADAFQEKVTDSLTPVMSRLVAAVEGLRSDQKEGNDSALEMMVEKFAESLSGTAGQELNALGSTLNDLNEKLGTQIAEMSERHREIEDASRDTVTQLGTAFNSGIEQFRNEVSASIKTITSGLGGVVEEMAQQIRDAAHEATERFGRLTTDFERAIADVRESLGGAVELSEKYREIVDRTEATLIAVNHANEALGSIVEPINDTARQFTETSQEMQNVAHGMTEASTELSQAISNLAGMQDEIKAVWENYQSRFEQVDETLAATFAELESGLGHYTQTVKEFVEGLDLHTSSIVSDLAGANNELNSAIEELSDTLGRRQ